MSKERIIFPESEGSAHFQPVSGWVSREGRFYGHDEQAARWGGATHVKCSKCGKPTSKSWTVCKKCREENAALKYLNFPSEEWDEDVPVYSQITNKYYWNREEVRDENPEGIFDPVSLELVLCKPVYAGEVDPEVYYEHLLPDEDYELNQVLVDAFQELNDTINEAKVILSYEPTDIAVV